jgi:K+ transporter
MMPKHSAESGSGPRSARHGAATIEESIFAFLTRNSRPASPHLKLPAGQVIEIGMQIDL